MIKREIYEKWAKKLAIPEEKSKFVNDFIVSPKKYKEFQSYCEENELIYSKGRPTKIKILNLLSKKSDMRSLQLRFLQKKGDEYVQAAYLHYSLIYIAWWVNNWELPLPSIEEMLRDKKLKEKIGDPSDPKLQKVKNFILSHADEIIRDVNKTNY